MLRSIPFPPSPRAPQDIPKEDPLKALVASACFSLVLVQSLATDYTKERSLRIDNDLQVELSTTAMEMERDGEPMPSRGGLGDNKSVETRRIARVDAFLAHEGGAPTKVRRTFEEVEGKTTASFGGQEQERELESRLSGAVVELALVDGEVEVKTVKGDPPAEALEQQQLALALDRLLPSKAVEEGATWSPEEADVRAALGLASFQAAYERPAPPEGGGEGGGQRRGGRGMGGGGGGVSQMLALKEWKATATLTGDTVEHEGVSCMVIKLEIECSEELAEPERSGGGGGRAFGLEPVAALATTCDVELAGRLLYSAAEKRPVLLELEGPVKIESNIERAGREGGTMKIHTVREGTWKQSVSIGKPTE